MATITDQIISTSADSRLRAQYDHRSPLGQVVDTVISLVRYLHYSVTAPYRSWVHSTIHQPQMEWKKDSQGLVVLIHGLRNSPAAWNTQLSYLRKYHQIDVFAPTVPHKGMCSLEEAAMPILPKVLDYVEKHPGKPVCLLGVSNGGRIVLWLDPQLRQKAPNTPVKISNIAGVHFGSRRMNLLENIGLAKRFYPEALRQELQYGSSKAKELLQQVASSLPDRCAPRNYEFYATTEDLSVPDLDSTLPQINKGESHHVVHGHSHDSIVGAVAERQINSCVQWMKGFQQS